MPIKTKTEFLERSHRITDLLVRISLSRFPYGRPSQEDETYMPYWQDEALLEYTKLMTDIFYHLDHLHDHDEPKKGVVS